MGGAVQSRKIFDTVRPLPRPSSLAHLGLSKLNPIFYSAKFAALASLKDDGWTFLVRAMGDHRAIVVHLE
jgi:hypothetical protein